MRMRKIYLKEKLLLFLSVVLFLLITLNILREIINILNILKNEELSQIKIAKQYLKRRITHHLQDIETILEVILSNDDVVRNFAERHRENLKKLLKKTYNNLNEDYKVSQIHFHIPFSKSFLRLHLPNKHSDDLSSYREIVVLCHKNKKVYRGFEIGKGGMTFRVIEPVFYNGNFIGSLEVGLPLSLMFLKDVKTFTKMDYALISVVKFQKNKIKKAKPYILKKTKNFLINTKNNVLNKIQSTGKTRLNNTIKSQKYKYFLYPLKSYSNKTMAYIVGMLDDAVYTDVLKKQIRSSVIIFIIEIILILFVIFSWKHMRNLNFNLKNAYEEIKNLIKKKDNLIAMISHDLRSPFTSIIGYTDIILTNKNIAMSDIQKYVQKINSSANLELNYITDLLNLIRYEYGELKLKKELNDVLDLIKSAVDAVKIIAEQKNIDISIECKQGIELNIDGTKIIHVLNNLINNAIKFTNKDGTINVKCLDYQNYVEIHVIDNGVGIEEKRIDKLFTLYTRDHTYGTQGEKGTGLGLSIVKDIIELHGGKINVKSQKEKGSDFYFTLPK